MVAASLADEAASFVNARALPLLRRLVVVRQRHRLARAAEHGPRVAGVRDDQLVRADQARDRRAAGLHSMVL